MEDEVKCRFYNKNKYMKQGLLILFLFAAILATAQRNNFADVLNVRMHVTDTSNIETSFCSDMGAWHAFALPDRKEDYGSFIGPLLMDMEGKWLGNDFSHLHIFENGKEINITAATAELHYYPGLLQQKYVVGNLKIALQLIFVSSRSSMLQTIITDLSGKQRRLQLKWTGKTLLSATKYSVSPNKLDISFNTNQHLFSIQFEAKNKIDITANDGNYSALLNEVIVPANKKIELIQTQRYYLTTKEQATNPHSTNFAVELSKNEKRWNGYLDNYFNKAGNVVTTKNQQNLAVKSIITLMTNWRSAGKDLLSDGLFPSASYQGFYGFWSWDCWKQSVALSYFYPRLAMSNVNALFEYQDKEGMIPDCIYPDKKENNWRDTKPPLAAWSVWLVYEQTKDIRFLKKLYPMLVKYHEWWYVNRDHDQNGLCEFGSTDGTRIAAAWESGMDNAVRFDSAIMLKNNEQAWSLNQESVDLNVFLYAEKNYLARIATELGKNADAAKWKMEAEKMKQPIQQSFYNEQKGFYYDKMMGEKDQVVVEGPEGWLALWAGLATKSQAKRVSDIMQNEKKFNTLVPLPTLSADHPKFDPMNGYWRGPVWLDQFYFGIEGLNKYGYIKLAKDLQDKLWEHAAGLVGDKPIFENYHPLTGKGLNAVNFSWSASFILMMLKK
jgi:putative isomerase